MRGGPRGFIHRSTCDVLLRIPLIPTLDFVYRAFTFSGQPFQAVLLSSMVEYDVVLQPRRNTFGLGSIRFRSPLLTESISLSFPPLTEMFHFSGFRVSYPMYSGMNDRVLPRSGYPIRISPDHRLLPGSKDVCSSPGIIAACRVLLRLLAPRHSPYALTYFIILQKLLPLPQYHKALS